MLNRIRVSGDPRRAPKLLKPFKIEHGGNKSQNPSGVKCFFVPGEIFMVKGQIGGFLAPFGPQDGQLLEQQPGRGGGAQVFLGRDGAP